MHYHQQPIHKVEITNRTNTGLNKYRLNKTNQTKPHQNKKQTYKEINRKPHLVSSHQYHHGYYSTYKQLQIETRVGHCRQTSDRRLSSSCLSKWWQISKDFQLPKPSTCNNSERMKRSKNVKQSGGQVWSVEVKLLQDLWPSKDKALQYLQRRFQDAKSQGKALRLIYTTSQK